MNLHTNGVTIALPSSTEEVLRPNTRRPESAWPALVEKRRREIREALSVRRNDWATKVQDAQCRRDGSCDLCSPSTIPTVDLQLSPEELQREHRGW